MRLVEEPLHWHIHPLVLISIRWCLVLTHGEKKRKEKRKKRKTASPCRQAVNSGTLFMHFVKCRRFKCKTATPRSVSDFNCHRMLMASEMFLLGFPSPLSCSSTLLFLLPVSSASPPPPLRVGIRLFCFTFVIPYPFFLLLTLLSLSPLDFSSLRPMKARLVVMCIQTKVGCYIPNFHECAILCFFACP